MYLPLAFFNKNLKLSKTDSFCFCLYNFILLYFFLYELQIRKESSTELLSEITISKLSKFCLTTDSRHLDIVFAAL